MFALSKGELAIVVFIFALVWVAGVLPGAAERLAGRVAAKRAHEARDRQVSGSAEALSKTKGR
jgi:Sec-independent protein translocase protein TatA